ncbi:unnamed protein product [Lampetra planeri]
MSPLQFVLLSMAEEDGDAMWSGKEDATVLKETSFIRAPATSSATIVGCRDTSPRGVTLHVDDASSHHRRLPGRHQLQGAPR